MSNPSTTSDIPINEGTVETEQTTSAHATTIASAAAQASAGARAGKSHASSVRRVDSSPAQPNGTPQQQGQNASDPQAQAMQAAAGAMPQMQGVPFVLLNVEAPNGKSVKVETTAADCILDIRQFLLDCPETCEYTSYHLEFNGIPLNDYLELAEYSELLNGQTNTIKIQPDFYDERAARMNVRRLRELLVNPPAHIQHSYVPAIDNHYGAQQQGDKKDKKSKKEKKKEKQGTTNTSMEDQDSTTTTDTSASQQHHPTNTDAAITSSLSELGENDQINLPAELKAAEVSLLAAGVPSNTFSLLTYLQDGKKHKKDLVQECVRNINFSAWNPPPGNRRLRGDLFYLEVTTLENNVLFITASVDGFYLNLSTASKFDPTPADASYKSHTLVELLKRASPTFNTRFNKLLTRKVLSHPFEHIEVPRHTTEWCAAAPAHTYDWNRAEDALLATHGMDTRGVLRDWNEEYQSCRDLPRKTVPDRLLRDRTTYRIYTDFVDAATKGSVAVIHGFIPPCNPMDPIRTHVYIYNNIFFSYAVDARDQWADCGGDLVAYYQANHDLRGIQAYAEVDLNEVYTLATAIIDYRGHRVLAQSIIPGIFHGDRASKHVYGSMDQGDTIESKEEFHALMLKAAEKLHIAEHTLQDKNGKSTKLATCVDTKGIVGSDGRNYILDLLRVQPRDANYPDHKLFPTALIRKELITLYCRQQAVDKLFTNKEKQQENTDGTNNTTENKTTESDTKTDDSKEAEKKAKDVVDSTNSDENAPYMKFIQAITFNPDVFTSARLGESEEKIEKDRELVKSVSKFLLDNIIPKLIASFTQLEYSPVDGAQLTKILHERGINMRYLGKIATLAKEANLPHIEQLCIEEMIVRAAKHILAGVLKEVEPDRSKKTEHWFLAPAIAHFLSSLLGPHSAGAKLTAEQFTAASKVLEQLDEQRQQQHQQLQQQIHMQNNMHNESGDIKEGEQGVEIKKAKKHNKSKKNKEQTVVRLPDGSRAPTDPLASANLWQQIRLSVASKYSYPLLQSYHFTARDKICMLRNVCAKCGIQILSRDYDLSPSSTESTPFQIDDILDLFPVVKAYLPKCQDAYDLLESGKAYLFQGRLQFAYQYLSEALTFHNQVYGPMHPDSAQCYSTLALVCYHATDYAQAVDFQQRALIIFERVYGKDNAESAHAHMQLALYLHSIQQIQAAEYHCSRALYLFELISGSTHPDTAAAHMNIAMIYQDSARIQLGLKHLLTALDINIRTLSENHVQVGLTYHAVAIAYSLMGAFRQAIEHEKKSKQIYTAAVGPKHPRVTQSKYWINQFTAGAVHITKNGKSPIPQQIQSQSPLTWVSLRSSTPFKGRLTMHDVLQLFETAAARSDLNGQDNSLDAQLVQAQQLQQQGVNATASTSDGSVAEIVEIEDEQGPQNASTAGVDKKQKQKEKRKKQKAAKKSVTITVTAPSTPNAQ